MADFPGGSDGKESACSARDLGLIPGSGRSPQEGTGYIPVFLTVKFHGQRSLAGYQSMGLQKWTMPEQLTLSLSLIEDGILILSPRDLKDPENWE